MAIQQVNLGAAGTGAGGDPLRAAIAKINANFAATENAASKLVMSGLGSTVADRLMPVGAFGLGSTGGVLNLNGAEWSTVWCTGWFMSYNSPDAPFQGAWFIGHYEQHNTLYGVLTVTSFTGASGRKFWRAKVNGVWSAWKETLSRADIVGTVSQSAGAPTGAIVEAGSNANGRYTRYADGTQICAWTDTVATAVTTAFGSLYFSGMTLRNWPAGFVDVPDVAPAGGFLSGDTTGSVGWSVVRSQSKTACYLYAASFANNGKAALGYIAYGRWF